MTGWGFVAVQAALLVSLAISPRADDWPTPGWLDVLGYAAMVAGLVVVVVAGRRLGSALTPTPVPADHATLATAGPYRRVRHPIYSGVLLVVLGIAIRSGSLVTAAVALITVAFFHLKAAWEERRLAERYPDYARYAAATPRFVPRIRPAE
jgi:protein-S-isoprenylcysteine O-methyltransferase Ste14